MIIGREKRTRKDAIQHIAVHCTGTIPGTQIKELDKLPYHYLVTRAGRLLNLQPVKQGERHLHIAWVGGLDKDSKHADNRTVLQNEALFTALVFLSDYFSEAQITPAETLQAYNYANPGFDLKAWLGAYIPDVLAA